MGRTSVSLGTFFPLFSRFLIFITSLVLFCDKARSEIVTLSPTLPITRLKDIGCQFCAPQNCQLSEILRNITIFFQTDFISLLFVETSCVPPYEESCMID